MEVSRVEGTPHSILVIEDNPTFRFFIRDALENHSDLKIVREATSFGEALEAVDQVGNGELDVQLAVIDGNMCESRNCGTDAQKIHERIQELGIPMKIIGFSSGWIPADFDAFVPKMEAHKLPEAIKGVLSNASSSDH